MADNVTVDNATLTDYTIATDDDGSAQHQYVKLEYGADGTFTKVATGASALPVQDGGNSLTVDGTVTVGTGPKASSAALSNVNDTASSTTLLASNANRLGATIVNDSTSILYVKFGATASATSFTYKLLAGDTLEFPQPVYTGVVDGIWSADASGAARVTEMS